MRHPPVAEMVQEQVVAEVLQDEVRPIEHAEVLDLEHGVRRARHRLPAQRPLDQQRREPGVPPQRAPVVAVRSGVGQPQRLRGEPRRRHVEVDQFGVLGERGRQPPRSARPGPLAIASPLAREADFRCQGPLLSVA